MFPTVTNLFGRLLPFFICVFKSPCRLEHSLYRLEHSLLLPGDVILDDRMMSSPPHWGTPNPLTSASVSL